MPTLYLIRHGQTDYNLQGIVQGRGVDSELNSTGLVQANAFYDRYMDLNPNHVFTSSLKRTGQTVARFIGNSLPTTAHAELDEISWGELEGMSSTPQVKAKLDSMNRDWNAGKTWQKTLLGESPEDVQKRLIPITKLWKSNFEQDDKLLICSHGRSMRVLMCTLLGLPLSDMYRFSHHNTGLYIVEWNEGHSPRLVLSNCTNHLEA